MDGWTTSLSIKSHLYSLYRTLILVKCQAQKDIEFPFEIFQSEDMDKGQLLSDKNVESLGLHLKFILFILLFNQNHFKQGL